MTRTNLDFVALHTADLDAARRFYTEVLGFDLAESSPPRAAVFRHSGGASLAVRLPQPHEAQQPPFGVGVSVWFGVPDARAYHAQLTQRGAQLLTAPTPGPFGVMFSLQTLDGHALTFHEVSR
ncbi:VOC family protein [Deinococcus alpinitundrae]|uniref:VOC family protein n=1 Tax=Deinococcus alpinitundrae TaxID=468913 RepID=UPI001379530B|nr:VOC family protein [Deinococcus alpinitundrae]